MALMRCSASNTTKGGAIGAGAGAVIGGIIGAAGGLIGNYMDKRAEELQNDNKVAKIERVGEGIKITFNSGILFQTAFSDRRAQSVVNFDANLGVDPSRSTAIHN
jgi:gas vesicle protein